MWSKYFWSRILILIMAVDFWHLNFSDPFSAYRIKLLKYFSSFAADEKEGNYLLNKWLPSLFFANFTAAKDEKYFE